MSGGSYNYLCYTECIEDLAKASGHLKRMRDRLAGLGYARDAALETEDLLVILRQAEIRACVRIERLRDVWKAVEWWDSCDYSEDQVKEALEEYRNAG